MLVFELGHKIYTAPVTDDLDINPRCFQPLQGSLVVNILTDNDTSHTTDDDGPGAHRARRLGGHDENVLVRCERLLHDTAKTIQFGVREILTILDLAVPSASYDFSVANEDRPKGHASFSDAGRCFLQCSVEVCVVGQWLSFLDPFEQ